MIEPRLLQVELLEAGGHEIVPVDLIQMINGSTKCQSEYRGAVVSFLRGSELLDKRGR